MERTRLLNDEEKCELINVLANAKSRNNRKANSFKAASDDAHYPQERADLSATAERCSSWAQLDERLIKAIRDGKLVMILDELEEG